MNERTHTPRSSVAFADLALRYFPHCTTSASAVRCLNRWIARNTTALSRLHSTGYAPYNHRYLTPLQVRIICEEFGEP